VIRRSIALLVVAVVAAGCASGDGGQTDQEAASFSQGSFALVANSDLGTGPARLLVGVLEEDGTRIGSPEDPVEIEVAPADGDGTTQRVPGVFTWILEDVTGLYRADVSFDTPGTWTMTVEPAGGQPLPAVPITVREETYAPNIGEPAPVAPTPTLADAPIQDLTTDPEPDPRFYETTLDEALSSGRPTVLVFATPAYCTSGACGPMLDTVKEVAADYPDVNFIQIEVYTGFNEPGFAPDAAHLAPAVGPDYWDLPSEPWVFVMDDQGIVTGRFEGVMAPEELSGLLG
jgi:hypothetical protein